MRFRFWPTVAGVVLTTAPVAVSLVLLEGFRAEVERAAGTALPPAWALLALEAGVAACLAVAVAWQCQRRSHRLLQDLAARITAVQTNPSHQIVQANAAVKPANDDLALVLSRLDGLVSCYRHALAEVVHAQEMVEKLRASDAKTGAGDDALGPTRYLGGGARRRMIARLAPNLHWIAATTPLQQFIGRNIADLVARSFLDVVHPDDAAGLQAALQEALKDGEGHDITFRVLTPGKPGRKRSLRGDSGLSLVESHLLMDVMTCYSEAGAPLNLRCHLLDVTERVLTERELRRRTEELSQANARLRADQRRPATAQGELPRPVPPRPRPLFQPRRPAAGWPPATRRWCGRWATRGEELIGRPYTLLLTPAGRAAYRADRTVFQRPGEMETRWVKRDGTVIDVWIGTTTIKDEEGRFIRSRSVALDLTERKRLADEPARQGRRAGAGQRPAAPHQPGTGRFHLRRVARPQGTVAHAGGVQHLPGPGLRAGPGRARDANTSTT